MSNSLDPDQTRHIVGPDLGPNCLQRLSADDTSWQRAMLEVFFRETCFYFTLNHGLDGASSGHYPWQHWTQSVNIVNRSSNNTRKSLHPYLLSGDKPIALATEGRIQVRIFNSAC